MSEQPLAGKVVLIAGGSHGIGLATAMLAARSGADVVVLARGAEQLQAAAERIGPRAVPIRADLTDPDQVRGAFASVDERFGRLDAVLYVAGTGRPRLLEKSTDADLLAQTGVNLLGPMFVARAAIPLLRRSGAGDLVLVSSESTLDPAPYLAVYAATKAGMECLATGIANETRGDGIRVSAFRCGHTDTGFSRDWPAAERERVYRRLEETGFLQRIAGRTAMAPADVAEALLFVITRPRGQMLDTISVRASS